jgi:hypothetical protein
MRWTVPAVAFVLSCSVATRAAAPAVTIGERQLAVNLHRRLTSEPTSAPKDLSRAMARVYLRRAYVVELGPAEVWAKAVLQPDYGGLKTRKVEDDQRLRLFAWGLDALVRGAQPKDLISALQTIWKETYREDDRLFHAETLFGVSRRYASPVPLAELIEELGDNGVVGQRQREFITWAASVVKGGENPAELVEMYGAIGKVNPSGEYQRRVMEKAYEAIRRGAPPKGMVDAVQRLVARTQVPRRLEAGIGDIARFFLGGLSFERAVEQVLPPEKKGAPK